MTTKSVHNSGEDQLTCEVRRGINQYVVLGAGLDTLAYRNPHRNLRVFEVDYRATQEWKRHRLGAAGIAIPESVSFVAVDFEKQEFAEELCRAGFNREASAFFSWLGVTQYLARETVFAALRAIVSISPGNGVVFDYAVPRSSLDGPHQMAFDALWRRLAAASEPFQGFFEPAELSRELNGMGFRHVEDLDGREINARYFRGRADGLGVSGRLAHLMYAKVRSRFRQRSCGTPPGDPQFVRGRR
jgi:methyltransferase (TIGR00027 family)